MIKSGYSTAGSMNESFNDTYINKEDKITPAKLKKEISTYPVGTYLRCAVKGNINDISRFTYGKMKTGNNEWKAHSSFYGVDMDCEPITDSELLAFITDKGIKNIGVKLPKK